MILHCIYFNKTKTTRLYDIHNHKCFLYTRPGIFLIAVNYTLINVSLRQNICYWVSAYTYYLTKMDIIQLIFCPFYYKNYYLVFLTSVFGSLLHCSLNILGN